MIVPVILSGGTGSRLWPLSRELYPKQFLALAGEQTLLQDTARRLGGLPEAAAPIVVCNEEHRFMAAEQLRAIEVLPAAIILEPCGRNTAPAVAVAALQATAAGEDPLLLVLPADHVIQDRERFALAVVQVAPVAQEGRLVTFGVVPAGPETGYGYIKVGEALAGGHVYKVGRFVEKPDPEAARRYVDSGEFYWNSGMFMFRASRFLDELERFAPDILRACREAVSAAREDMDFVRLDPGAFRACRGDSIDYAVMEKTDQAAVMPLNVGWNDIGSWSALWEAGTANGGGNVLVGDVVTRESRNCYVRSSQRLVATVGVEDTIVVDTADVVLVAHKDRVQDVKAVVEQLRKAGREEVRAHRRVYRPWGHYETIDRAARFQVKHITVKPGARLSLQKHHHRAEHWVVVRGTALVARGEETFLLSENQSTYIPLGVSHRLENPGRIPLELIEVQSGSYLGEDDIVRYDDIYGRAGDAVTP